MLNYLCMALIKNITVLIAFEISEITMSQDVLENCLLTSVKQRTADQYEKGEEGELLL